jgi:hypothetical protein
MRAARAGHLACELLKEAALPSSLYLMWVWRGEYCIGTEFFSAEAGLLKSSSVPRGPSHEGQG